MTSTPISAGISWASRLEYPVTQSFVPTEKPLFGTVLFPAETTKVSRHIFLIALREKLTAIEAMYPGALMRICQCLPIPELEATPQGMIGHPEFRAWLSPLLWTLPASPINGIPDHQKYLDLDALMLELEA
jgi:hypothetical protein